MALKDWFRPYPGARVALDPFEAEARRLSDEFAAKTAAAKKPGIAVGPTAPVMTATNHPTPQQLYGQASIQNAIAQAQHQANQAYANQLGNYLQQQAAAYQQGLQQPQTYGNLPYLSASSGPITITVGAGGGGGNSIHPSTGGGNGGAGYAVFTSTQLGAGGTAGYYQSPKFPNDWLLQYEEERALAAEARVVEET